MELIKHFVHVQTITINTPRRTSAQLVVLAMGYKVRQVEFISKRLLSNTKDNYMLRKSIANYKHRV